MTTTATWDLKDDDGDMEFRIVRECGPGSRQYTCFDVEEGDDGVLFVFFGTRLEHGDSAVLGQAMDEGELLRLLKTRYPGATEVRWGC